MTSTENPRPASPWRPRLLAVLAGILAALAHPPFGFLPGLLGYGLLMLVVGADGPRPLRSAFFRGWLAGVAYFGVGTWWIAEAFLVDIVHHGWMAPIAVSGMAGGIALFWGAAALLYRWLNPRGLIRPLVFAGALTALEWLRGHVLTGFPWNLPGESWKAGSAMSQTAAFVGAYGLSWITVAIAATFALLWPRWGKGRDRIAATAAALVLATLWAGGAARLAGADTTPAAAAPLLRIIQPDVRQEAKYDPAIFNDIVARYLRLTATPAKARPDIVIWPEGAIPASINEYLSPEAWTRAAILDALEPGQVLMVGAYRVEGSADRPVYYNSLAVLRRTATDLQPVGLYDKFRLVPFGEYLPLEGLLAPLGIKKLVHVGDRFTPGPRPRAMALNGLPAVQPLICYESLFPGFTREGVRASGLAPRWIVNVSNDAWYGTTSGPLQHLNLASYRAIEEGLPMARATPTGVSGLIDAFGRLVPGSAIGQGASGFVDVRLPPPAPTTLYRRLGDGAVLWMLLISLAALIPTRFWRWTRKGEAG